MEHPEKLSCWALLVSGALPDLKKQGVAGDTWDGEGEEGILIDLNPRPKGPKGPGGGPGGGPSNLKRAGR